MATKKTITTNEMIYNTLLTSVSKTPKYITELQAMGYHVRIVDYYGEESWAVDCLSIRKFPSNKNTLFKGENTLVTRTNAEIAKVDLVNMIETYEYRKAKREEMFSRKGIWQERETSKRRVWSSSTKKMETRRYSRYYGDNETIHHYKDLRERADDGNLDYYKHSLERSKKALEEAMANYEHCLEEIETANQSLLNKKRDLDLFRIETGLVK